MKKKHVLLAVVAVLLVCSLSVMGTLAYLKNQTATVTNTFVAAGGGKLLDDDAGFSLQEHKVEKDVNGKYDYVLENGEKVVVTENDYAVMPGMVIPKNPYVTLNNKTETPAYLYVECINNLPFSTVVDGVETLVIDSAHWLKLDIAGRDIYVYTEDGVNAKAITADLGDVNIIAGDQFMVDKNADLSDVTDATLKFNAYLSQASAGDKTDPAAVFTTCFG